MEQVPSSTYFGAASRRATGGSSTPDALSRPGELGSAFASRGTAYPRCLSFIGSEWVAEPAGLCTMAGGQTVAADGARRGQSRVAGAFRRRAGGHAGRLWYSGGHARLSRTAGLASRGL